MIEKVDGVIAAVEGVVVSALLTVMILLAFFQVILRNFLNGGLPWADIFLRNLVLWVCFLGASLSTKEQRHINIDVLGRLLPSGWRRAAGSLVNLASSVVCGFLVAAAWRFLEDERLYGGFLFDGIPTWYFLTIAPVSLALMCARFFLHAIPVKREPAQT